MNEYYKQVDSGEMFDFKAFYDSIANQLPDGCIIAELGVANGHSALYLASKLISLGKRYKLVMVDNLAYGGNNQLNEIIMHIIQSGLPNIQFLAMSAVDASIKFPDNHFDFVFIDSSHEYEPTKAEIRLWLHKVKEGAIIAGHDYATCEGVRDAVNQVLKYDDVQLVETERGFGVWWFKK